MSYFTPYSCNALLSLQHAGSDEAGLHLPCSATLAVLQVAVPFAQATPAWYKATALVKNPDTYV